MSIQTQIDRILANIAAAYTAAQSKGAIMPDVQDSEHLSDCILSIQCVEVIPYLTFSSPYSFTLEVEDTTKHWDGTLEYSTDASTWFTWNGTTTLSSATSGNDNVLYLRGTGNTVITGDSSKYKWILTGTDISCIGNIENLLDYTTVKSRAHPTMATNCYYCMFNGCAVLIKAPDLPATTLAERCYDSMLRGCTNLTNAPDLPATTLANYCYYSMFSGCTNLTKAPDLPATTLAERCYYSMFNGCTSLTNAPALPATTLATSCYYNMFRGCTSLTNAPALHATTLARDCYGYMFYNCTSLTNAPALPATTLGINCYEYMFYGCTSLTNAPALPATTLAASCYKYMFSGCISLTHVPALPATKLANNCYQYMFQKCSKIKLSSTRTGEYTIAYRIPSSGTGTTANNALSSMFTTTGGTFKGSPTINTTYYLSNTNTVVPAA